MKTINVNSKQYVLEFTFEAAMHEACVENVIGLIDGMAIAQANNDVNGYVSGIAKAPKTVINMMYAGLLEHHGNEIKTVKDASNLIKEYFAEHKDDESGNFISLMSLLIECMDEDGFFKMIGLEEIMKADQTEETKKQSKTPQDHKKKVTKISEK